jgi:biopolymer transport protein ExbD
VKRRSTTFGGDDETLVKSNRTGSDADIDITPMIDVVFLLLIFFMVTSSMKDSRTNDVPPSKRGLSVDSTSAITLTINRPVDPNAAPEIILSDGETVGTLDDIKADVEQAVEGGRNRVILKADRDVPNGVTLEVMKRANQVEGIQFYFEVRDKSKSR